MNIKKILTIYIILTTGCSFNLSFPDTSGCIRECNEINNLCLGAEHKCPEGDQCFNDLEKCFDNANSCNHSCQGCEEMYTCASEDDCRNACGDMANSCAQKIRQCFNITESCVKDEVKYKESCLGGPDGFTECIAGCIEDVEDSLDNL
jgi:hypothetical protein